MRISIAWHVVRNFMLLAVPVVATSVVMFAAFTVSVVTTATIAYSDESLPDAVEWIRSAKDSKLLKVDFYAPDQRPNAYPGWTDFELTLEYKYNHRTRWNPTSGDQLAVTILPTFTLVKPVVSHAIQLPDSIDASQWHDSTLGRHELDHVAIGSHPRLILLAKHLVKNLGKLNRTVDNRSDVTQKWTQDLITEEVTARRRAVQRVAMSNNDRLDELTRHGGNDLDRREEFFDRLFLKENLDAAKFPYLGDVLKLVESDEYLSATVPFSH